MAQNRTVRNQVNFRVDDKEYAILKAKADVAGLSPSMYAKQQALNGKVKAPVITKDIGSLILPEISKIGSNVNQIAKKLNQGGSPMLSEFKEIQAEFETLWAYVLDGKKPTQKPKQTPQPPRCELCGAELVEGKKNDGTPIWFCPNWENQENGTHTALKRE